MSLIYWILLSTIIITIGLLIFANIKHFLVLQKTCDCLTLPLIGSFIILWLTKYLPDSYHLIIISIFAFSLVTISSAFLAFEKITPLRILGRIASIANIMCWNILYRAVFKIHSVPVWMCILAIFIYTAVIIISCIFAGKHNAKHYALFILSFLTAAYLHFCSLIFLCWERTGSSVMLFSGTTLLAGLVAFHFINHTKLKMKHAGVLRFLLLVASQTLIACSNILMIK